MKIEKPTIDLDIPLTNNGKKITINFLKNYYKVILPNVKSGIDLKNVFCKSNVKCINISCSNCIMCCANINKLKKYIDEYEEYEKKIEESDKNFLEEKMKKAEQILSNN